MPQSREALALEALTLLLDLADHRQECIVCQKNVKDFCAFEIPRGKRYSQLIGQIYSGKHKRIVRR